MLDYISTVIELRSHGNSIKFHLESSWNLSGISLEFSGNSIQIPLGTHRNHSGIFMEFPWNSTEISLEIHGNPQEWHIPTIPVEFQHSCGFCQSLPELMEEGKVLLLLNEAEETHLPEDSQTLLPVFAH